MYAIITFSTDMRARDYKIEFTQAESKARKACGREAVLTHENPEEERNYHHNFTEVYVMPLGWKKPTKKVLSDEVFNRRGSIYSPNVREMMYKFIVKDGSRLE